MKKNDLLEERLEKFVDSAYYLGAYDDVRASGLGAVAHYVKFGWREGRRPNRWFTDSMVPESLVKQYPSAPPFALYLRFMSDSDLQEMNEHVVESAGRDLGHADCWACDVMRSKFNSAYYRKKYSDLDEVSDALAHYCEIGWRELRDPCVGFSTRYYLDGNSDVKNADINPFVHYLSRGCKEGRKPQPEDVVLRESLEGLRTIREMSNDYFNIRPRLHLAFEEQLFVKLLAHGDKGAGICVVASHDDYLNHTGGVQKFIRDEANAAIDRGYGYLHLCPAVPDLKLDSDSALSTFLINATLNGEFIGTFTGREVIQALDGVQSKVAGALKVGVVHSLMGWSTATAAGIFAREFGQVFFYVHDYFALCPEYRLLRNNVAPCDAPGLDSVTCSICAHGHGRPRHVAHFSEFFDVVKPTFLHPSKCSLGIFKEGLGRKDLAHVLVPHLSVARKSVEAPAGLRKRDSVRVAFCGQPVAHKGIFHFERIVEHCRLNEGLEFYHFGTTPSRIRGVQFVKTQLVKGVSEMSLKLRENDIDIVFVGSTWRETFNFVAYEAVAAGSAVMTLDTSGNVSDFVKDHGLGCVAVSWQACVDILNDQTLPAVLEGWRSSAEILEFKPNTSFMTDGVRANGK